MKIVRTFGIVLALHVVGGLLFFQPGCQTQPKPDAGETAPALGEPMERLDWEADDSFVDNRRVRAAPTRPSPGERFDLDEPVLRPLAPAVEIPEAGGTYTVRSGDSLWLIAQRNNVSLRALLDANGMTENSVIRPGQELRLPAGASGAASRPATASAPEGTTTYVVRSGDSLSVIARRHGTTVSHLKDINNLTSDIIRVDQRLIVPDRQPGSALPPEPRAATPPPAGSKIHTVKSGETPGGIAAHYGVSVNALMSANNITDPRRMRVGQELVIPGATASQRTVAPARTEEAPRSAPPPAPPPPPPAPPPVEIEEIPFEDDGDFPIVPILPNS